MRDTRKILSYFWSVVSAVFIGYILYRFGDKMEILTLIIGFVSGSIVQPVFGVYFSATNHTKQEPGTATIDIQATAETTKDE